LTFSSIIYFSSSQINLQASRILHLTYAFHNTKSYYHVYLLFFNKYKKKINNSTREHKYSLKNIPQTFCGLL